MAINVSQSFHRTSSNAVDDTLTLTKAQMLAVNDNLMPSKYLTVCQDDGYIYLYDKSATPNGTTGKFTKFEGGGGGVTDYDDLTDKPQIGGVTLSGNKSLSDLGITKSGLKLGSVVNTGDSDTPTSGGTTKFTTGGAYTELAKKQDKLTASTNITIDSSNNISASMPMLGTIDRSMLLSTIEKVVGCNADGRPIYMKSVAFGALPNNAIKTVAHGISNLNHIVDIIAGGITAASNRYILPWADLTATTNSVNITVDATSIKVQTKANASTDTIPYITLYYTKTTDAANSYNYANENDYSTTEKIIGKWTDGTTLFQCTFADEIGQSTTAGTLTGVILRTISNCQIKRIVNATRTLTDGYVAYLPVINPTNGYYAQVVASTNTNNECVVTLVTTQNNTPSSLITYTLQYTKS